MNYKISVIIPIYNAERYLERSIKSIINQSIGFENIELILVDDNSTDNSKKIILNYSNTYDNIKPLFLDNNHGGPSTPRNEGIKISSADYIMFIDNDDEYEYRICEKLYNKIIQHDIDCVCCRNCRINDDGKIIRTHFTNNESDEIYFKGEELLKFDDLVVWNKIFKKDIIVKNNIKFPNSRDEDYYFTYIYFIHSRSMLFLKNYFGYKWHIIEGSLSNGFTYKKYSDLLCMYSKLLDEINNNDINPKLFFKRRIRSRLILTMCFDDIFYRNDEEIYSLFEKYCSFEEKLKISENIGIVCDIANYLLMHKRFFIGKMYLKILTKLNNSNFIRNRKIIMRIYDKFK